MLKLEARMPANMALIGWEKIPIQDCGENLVPLSNLDPTRLKTEYQYLQSLGKPIPVDITPELYLREGAAERLHLAARLLQQEMGTGYYLMVNTAHRTIIEQEAIFQRVIERLRKEHPGRNGTDVSNMASQFASPNGNQPKNPSPHLTGGAVDVSVLNGRDRAWMAPPGTNIYSINSYIGYYEQATCEPELTYKRNRRALFEAMTNAGFVANPVERWDYHFGNQIWALRKKTVAIYGIAKSNP